VAGVHTPLGRSRGIQISGISVAPETGVMIISTWSAEFENVVLHEILIISL